MSMNGFMDWITVPDEQGNEHQLGFDSDGWLYWDKKRVLTEQKVTLPSAVNWSIIFGAGSTVVLAVMAVLQYCRG
jgi:hypothetical protein